MIRISEGKSKQACFLPSGSVFDVVNVRMNRVQRRDCLFFAWLAIVSGTDAILRGRCQPYCRAAGVQDAQSAGTKNREPANGSLFFGSVEEPFVDKALPDFGPVDEGAFDTVFELDRAAQRAVVDIEIGEDFR